MSRVLPLVVILGLLLVAAVVWDASEQHYRGCVEAAVGRTSAATLPTGNPFDNAAFGDVELRSSAVEGCSRLP